MKKIINTVLLTFFTISLYAQSNFVIELKMNDTLSTEEKFAFSYSIKPKKGNCLYTIKNLIIKYSTGHDFNIEFQKEDEKGVYFPYSPYLPPHIDPYYGMQKRDTKYCKSINLVDTLYNIIYRIDKGNFRARIYYYDKINLKKIKLKRIAESNWYYFNVPKTYNFANL